MKYAKERGTIIAGQLKQLSTVKSINIDEWKMKVGCYLNIEEVDKAKEPFTAFYSQAMRWYGPDKHYWFRTNIKVPDEFDKKPIWLHIRTQLEHWDDSRNPQFLVFVNGEVVQGLDINHREILLTECANIGDEYQIDLQAYTGTMHNEFRLLGNLEVIDKEIQGLYYDIQVPLWGLNRMKEDDKIRLDIETIINETVNLIDLRKPYSEEFYESIHHARAYIKKALYEDFAGFDEVIATCIGHTHIDVAWLWTVEQVRQKSCRSFATVLKLMEEYPNYKFMSSQPILYAFVKERHPELYEKIKDRIKEGRWEAEGGMWVEADCNLTSGESLVRQFIFGKRFFKEEFGVDNRILWLPDVFGYSAALPQIMKKSGIDYFMTTKLAWNQFNKIPYDTFNWEGLDGSKVFTHLITTLGVGQQISNFFTTYNGMLHPDSIMGGWERYQNKDINNDILVSYGYGDGGGGPTRQMLETSVRMEKGIKGIPKVRQEFSRTYFEELESKVKDKKRLPKWVGELYFEYHRGTLTSMGRNKRSNRKSEYRMMELELLSVLASKKGMEYPVEDLKYIWELILRNQFHDILPGSSIKEVYDVTKVEYEEIDKKSQKLLDERLDAFIGSGEGITVFNTLGYNRSDIVELGDLDVSVLTDGSNLYPVQKTSEGNIAYINNIPSKGYLTLLAAEDINDKASKEAKTFIFEKYDLETPYYKIKLDEFGQFTSIYDKEFEREVLQHNKVGNELRVYEDKPMNFSNWDVDIYYEEKSWPVNDVTRMEFIDDGDLRLTLLIERKFFDTIIKQKIYFYKDSRRIDFNTYVDWTLSEHLLKVHFPVDVHTDEATFDIQFGNLKRKIHQNTSWDVARFEACGHKWVDLSEGAYGVSVLNDCKYGHSIKERNIGLTLIKSGTEPNPTTDQEEHFFTYSLYPHGGTWMESQTVQEGFGLNVPVKVVKGGNGLDRYSYSSVNKDNVILETIKQAEDGKGIIVRLYEIHNKRTVANVTLDGEIEAVVETNLLEEAMDTKLSTSEHGFTFTINPYEIKTYRVIFK